MKGKIKVTNLAQVGLVNGGNIPNYAFLYEASLIKHPDYFPGDEVQLGKRTFTYARADGACLDVQGVELRSTYVQTMDNIVTAVAIGGNSVTVDGGTHDALTKDILRNGYICIFNSDASVVQFRGIIGNDAADANADFTVYLDAPLHAAIDTTWNAEVFTCPWSAVRLSSDVSYTKVGVPTVPVSTTLMYFWVQTEGPIWIAPQINTGLGVGKERCAVWRHDGSLQTTADAGAYDTDQVAGTVIMGSGAGVGPLFALKHKI